MGEYSYIAVMQDGKEKKGTMEAKDAERVRQQLRSEGLIATEIKEQNILTRDINISLGGGVKARDLGVFCRQLSSIIKAGVTIVQALGMLAEQTENKALAKAIRDTQTAVEMGETLGDAMRHTKSVYPTILINMVDAGEASGSLDIAFERMATHFEKHARLTGMVKKAMIYPIVLISVAIVVMIVMSVVVVPKFTSMFADMGAQLPLITRIVMGISDFFIHRWYIALTLVVIIVLFLRFFTATPQGKIFFGKVAVKMPIFGKLNVKSVSANFSRTMSTLLSTGISVATALEITARSMNNILYKQALEQARYEVEQGVPTSTPLRKSGLFPPMVHHMLKIGEETGNIEDMLNKVAEYYEEEVELTTQGLTAAMEPAIIIVMALIVGTLVLAIYSPMISMYSNLGNL